MAGRGEEASRGGRDRKRAGAESPEPARISIISDQDRPPVNVFIGRIQGSVTVGENSTVDHVYMPRGQAARDSTDSDSDSDSDDDMAMFPESAKKAMKAAKKLYQQAKPKAASDGHLTKIEQQTQKVIDWIKRVKAPNRTVDRRLVRRISPAFGQGWRRVFRHLGLKDAQIDGAFHDSGNVQETVQQLLLKWTEQCEQPDIQTLTEALIRAEQLRIAEDLIKFSNDT